ncbi:MAG: nitroreductase family protein [Candidatus Schekmanbacteria bacterium]|nr:MAG: nitroreductase family protein [Candidatus Schekmanbacteria bacterium]
MEIEEAIKNRRSIRKFKDKDVPLPLLKEIIDTALWAPSPMNRQNWKIFLLKGKKKDQLVKICAESFPFIEPRLKKVFKPSIIEWTKNFFKTLGNAPVVVVVYSTPSGEELTSDIQGAAAFIQNLLLLLYAKGLGACWMTGPVNVKEDIDKFFGVEGLELIAVIPIGYPDQSPPVPPRKEGRVEYIGFDE